MKILTKRVYDAAEKSDGRRILVDRLWPRGLTKEKARVDAWVKGVAPSDGLRKWFAHDPAKWEEFKARYFRELDENDPALDALASAISGTKDVTLLFGAKDIERNNAVALKEYLKPGAGRKKGGAHGR